MADAVSLETWKAIVDKAVTDATAGDSKAREFIAVRLIGDGALPLMQLAVREFAQIGSDEEVSAAAELTAEHATSFRASFDESDTCLITRLCAVFARQTKRERPQSVNSVRRNARRVMLRRRRQMESDFSWLTPWEDLPEPEPAPVDPPKPKATRKTRKVKPVLPACN